MLGQDYLDQYDGSISKYIYIISNLLNLPEPQFLIQKLGLIIVPTSHSCYED